MPLSKEDPGDPSSRTYADFQLKHNEKIIIIDGLYSNYWVQIEETPINSHMYEVSYTDSADGPGGGSIDKNKTDMRPIGVENRTFDFTNAAGGPPITGFTAGFPVGILEGILGGIFEGILDPAMLSKLILAFGLVIGFRYRRKRIWAK